MNKRCFCQDAKSLFVLSEEMIMEVRSSKGDNRTMVKKLFIHQRRNGLPAIGKRKNMIWPFAEI
jgi:hypothetical protein